MLRWIEAEDPALASATIRPTEARARALPKLAHVPSYVMQEPKLKDAPPWNLSPGCSGLPMIVIGRSTPICPNGKAIASVEQAPAPRDIPAPLRAELRRNGFVEVWLFQSNGRFALKTLALPQRDS